MHLNLVAVAAENGGPSGGQPVHWSASHGLALGAADGTTAVDGSSTMAAALGPLAAGLQAYTTACAWTSVCTTFTATGVAAVSLQITLTAGAGQSVAGGAALGAIIGAMAGGGKGAAIGAGAGGAAGTGIVLATRGQATSLATETRLDFRLAAPVTITEQINN